MAFVITLPHGIYRIAANENEKNDVNIFFPPAVAHTISDEEFNKLKKNHARLTFADNTVSVIDDTDTSFENQETLEKYHENIKPLLKDFLEPSTGNDTKSLHNSIQSYSNTLESFNYSSITYPLNKSWEQYCEENSITYVHPLQIP